MSKTCHGCDIFIKHKNRSYIPCDAVEMGREKWKGKRCTAFEGEKYDRTKFKKEIIDAT